MQDKMLTLNKRGAVTLVVVALLIPILFVPVQAKDFRLKQVSSGLGIPWGLAFISADELLITQREGRASLLNITTGKVTGLSGLPEVLASGQGGLLDVAVPPDFKPGDWIYFTYSKPQNEKGATTLARSRLKNNRLENWNDLLVTQSATDTQRHYGSRIAFDDQGHLYFGVGDRGERPNGQNLMTHAGSILRLHLNGEIPRDNPFVNRPDALPEIWSYGHRNPQGLVWDNDNQRLWEIEHGPRGGDEINLIQKGKNYGWPIISYGKEYWGPFAVGEDTRREGMEQPVKYYVPSIAPGSLLFYQGDAFPHWKGALMTGALKLQHINIVTLDQQGRAIAEERILNDLGERIRALIQGPDGFIYFSTDTGKIFVIKPE